MPHDPNHVAALIIGRMKGDSGASSDDAGDTDSEMVDEMFSAMHQEHASDDDKAAFLDALKTFVTNCWHELEGGEDESDAGGY